jgi:regulator of protease activity HflC (stomatin/prohibitin superfamily)
MSQATSFTRRQIEKCDDEICLDVEETTWKKVAGGLPEAELRDYIMSHRFDELFELVEDGNNGQEPKVRVKRRKIYEIEQAILDQIRPGKLNGLGVLIKGVDIGKIDFPRKLTSVVVERMTSEERALGQAQAIESVGLAKTESMAALLDRMLTIITGEFPYADEDVVRQFILILQNLYQRALADDVLIKDMMEANSEALKKLAESEGPKIFSAGMLPDPAQLLVSQVKSHGK